MVKTGIGIDIHRLVPGRDCIIGGIKIPSPVGPEGHSDADVLLHAVTDALLGAAALGDIGEYFPDNDPDYLNADSAKLLLEVYAQVRVNYAVEHLDMTVIAEVPKLQPYKREIRTHIAELLDLDISQIALKATTAEQLGPIGEQRGIAAVAVVTLVEAENTHKEAWRELSPQSLAYLGDAVLELYVRRELLRRGIRKGSKLQREALSYVAAPAQAEIMRQLDPLLDSREREIYKWGRNTHCGAVPKNTDVAEYRSSTGLETLLGYLYLERRIERLEELIKYILEQKL